MALGDWLGKLPNRALGESGELSIDESAGDTAIWRNSID